MNEMDIDRRLGVLLAEPGRPSDPAFAERVVAAALIDRRFRAARQRAWQRAALDCIGAAAVGLSFFFLSQTEHDPVLGTISLQGPAMAGLIMLGLWAMVALPSPASARQRPLPA